MKRLLALIALLPFIGGAWVTWPSGEGSSSSSTSGGGIAGVVNVCSTCSKATITAALNDLYRPYGEPIEAAYDSRVTRNVIPIPDGGVADSAVMIAELATLPASGGKPLNRYKTVLVKHGSPPGGVQIKECLYRTASFACTCDDTFGEPGEIFATGSTITASSLTGGDLHEVVDFTFPADVAAPNSTTPVCFSIRGNAAYEAGNDVNNYIGIIEYAGGSNLKDPAYDAPVEESSECTGPGTPDACCTALSTGPCYANTQGTNAMVGYAYHSSFSETSPQTILLSPGVYAGPVATDVIPPHTRIASVARSAVIRGGSWNLMSDTLIDNAAITDTFDGKPPIDVYPNLWRGEERAFELNANTASGAATVVLKHNGREGDSLYDDADLVYNMETKASVIEISETGLPTQQFRVTAVTAASGTPGTQTITTDRNVGVVYTAAGATVKSWSVPTNEIRDSFTAAYFPTTAPQYTKHNFFINGGLHRAPLYGWIGPIPALTRVMTSYAYITTEQSSGTTTNSSGIQSGGGSASSAEYESNHDTIVFEGDPNQNISTLYVWVWANGGNVAFNNTMVEKKTTTTPLALFRNSNGGTAQCTNMAHKTQSGGVTYWCDSATDIDLHTCEVGDPVYTSGCAATNIKCDMCFGSAVGGAATTSTDITIPGMSSDGACACSGACTFTSTVSGAGKCTVNHIAGACNGVTIKCMGGRTWF